MVWHHVTTRLFGFFEIYMSNIPYSGFPVTEKGQRLDTIILGKKGIIKRYVDKQQFTELENVIKSKDLSPILLNFQKYEEQIMYIFDKNPIDNIKEFMDIFHELWIHEITSFFIGMFSKDEKTLQIASELRGTNNAQHKAVSKFLPKLFSQLAKKHQIEEDLLRYVLPEELIKEEFDVAKLKERRKEYAIELIEGKSRVIVGKELEAFKKEFEKNKEVEEEIPKGKTFKGQTAYPGKVKGKVVLIEKDSDIEKVKKGDIIVCPMTRTSFISAMKKAAAFITDEGGITCHAAIMAREMKTPCVVGTKHATKILKDGDKVEIDAEQGIIEKM